MDVRILGPLEVWEGSNQFAIDAPRQRSLLALLAIHVGEVLSTDRIVYDLWGDDPPGSPESTLRYHMSKLRAGLGEAACHLVTQAPGYVFDADPDAIDAFRFERLAAEGRKRISDDPERAARTLVDALAMWRGAPLADFTYETFARAEITRLEELRLRVLEDRIDADLASGRHADLVGELEALTAEHSLRERLWGQLMVALYRSGRQADALRAYQAARRALAEIGIEPSEGLRAIDERVLLQDPLLLPIRRPPRRHNLPERISSFVGRTHERSQLTQLVGKHRLVTLTGIGGVGKTSLAIETARGLVDGFADGVWLVEVADVGDPAMLAERVAHVLDVPTLSTDALMERIGEYLRQQSTLLILDGCERHVDSVAHLAESFLGVAPELRIMATSRELLEVVGECRFEVPVLRTEGVEADAVHLFKDRAALARGGFEATAENRKLAEQICSRVAGIPLAIELAAARLAVLSPEQVYERLDDQLSLLAQGRRSESPHGSLRAVLDWSHELLDSPERTLFRRLAVFHGGSTVEAIERVCADGTVPTAAVLDLLAHLVGGSLLVQDAETARIELLDPVWQYAAHHLEAAEEAGDLRRRHATYYRELAKHLSEGTFGRTEIEQAETYAREESNLTAAITWALNSGEAAFAIQMAADLSQIWSTTGRVAIADRFLARLLREARKEPSRALVMLLTHAAFLDAGGGVALAEEAVAVARDLDDEYALGHALMRAGTVIGWEVDFRPGVEAIRQALECFDRIQHPEAMACLLNLAGMLVRVSDGVDEAEAAAEGLLRRATDAGSIRSQALAHQALGWVAIRRGDFDSARLHTRTAMARHTEVHGYRWIAWGLHTLVEIELAAGNVSRAVAYLEELGSQFREIWGRSFLSMDGRVQLAVGDVAGGMRTLLDALARFATTSEIETEIALRQLGSACVTAGESSSAVRLYAAAERIRGRRDLGVAAHDAREIDANLGLLRSGLGEEAFGPEWLRGQEMTIGEIVAWAREALQGAHGPAEWVDRIQQQ